MKTWSVTLELSRIREIPDIIDLLAYDGKVTANLTFLRLTSSVVHAKLLENPDLFIIDLKDHKKATIDTLLRLIDGTITFKDDVEEQEVFSLAQDLGINISQTVATGKNIKIDAPKVPEEEPKLPEEEPKDEDPGWKEIDGKFICGLCNKTFNHNRNVKDHYYHVHKSKEKNIECSKEGCHKKFSNITYMKTHMRKSHGIYAKQIPSSSKTRKPRKGIKKVIVEEP